MEKTMQSETVCPLHSVVVYLPKIHVVRTCYTFATVLISQRQTVC